MSRLHRREHFQTPIGLDVSVPSHGQSACFSRDLVYPRTRGGRTERVHNHSHQVWHFEKRRTGLFWSYVDTWPNMEEEASGWPEGCTTPAQKQAHVDNYYAREGIRLDTSKIEKNPGLCALAKMMLNLMWEKFGHCINKSRVREFTDPLPFIKFLDSDQHHVCYGSSSQKTMSPRCPFFTQSQHLRGRFQDLSRQTPTLSRARSSRGTRSLFRHRLGRLPPGS